MEMIKANAPSEDEGAKRFFAYCTSSDFESLNANMSYDDILQNLILATEYRNLSATKELRRLLTLSVFKEVVGREGPLTIHGILMTSTFTLVEMEATLNSDELCRMKETSDTLVTVLDYVLNTDTDFSTLYYDRPAVESLIDTVAFSYTSDVNDAADVSCALIKKYDCETLSCKEEDILKKILKNEFLSCGVYTVEDVGSIVDLYDAGIFQYVDMYPATYGSGKHKQNLVYVEIKSNEYKVQTLLAEFKFLPSSMSLAFLKEHGEVLPKYEF